MMTDFQMDVVYLAVAVCVVYKLAWIIRQVSDIEGFAAQALRASAFVLGCIMLLRAGTRFLTIDDPAEWLDCARELGWCAFLASAIAVLRGPAGRY